MQCVILAGGLGTRLAGVTGDLPKHLVPVAGRPFCDYQLARLAAQGVEEVVYAIGHRGERIREHVGDGSRWGLRTVWVDEGERLRGTGGALRHCLDAGVLADAFLVTYGDSYLRLDLAAFAAAFAAAGRPAMMAVHRNEGRWEPSNVRYADGLVELYDKDAARRGERLGARHVDYGMLMLARALVARIPSGERHDLAPWLRALSLAGDLAGYEAPLRFFEIGSPAGLADFAAWVAAGEEHGA